MTDIAHLGIQVDSSGVVRATKNLDRMEKQGTKTDSSMRRLGGAFLAFGAVTGLKKALTTTAEFSQSIADLSAITGAVGKDLEFFANQSKEIGRTTSLSASQAAAAFKLIASAKPDLLASADALAAVTKQAVTLAEATGQDLPTAAKALGSALNQFQLPASKAAEVINILAASSKFGTAEVANVTEAMRNAGPAASALGIDFAETVSAIQGFAKAGIVGADAGSKLKQVLFALEKEGTSKTKPSIVGISVALQNLAKENKSVSELMDIFGKESAGAAAALLGQVDAVTSLNVSLRGTQTAVEQAAGRMDTLTGDVLSLGSAIEGLTLEAFGGSIEDLTRDITQLSTGAINGLTENMDTLADAGKVLALVIGARLAGSAATAGTSMLAAQIQAIRYQATLASLAGVSRTAAAGQIALAGATRVAGAAMSVLGGPVGVALLAAAGLYAYATRADDAADSTDYLSKSLDGLSVNQAKKRLFNLGPEFEEAQAKAIALADTIHTLKDRIADIVDNKKIEDVTGLKNLLIIAEGDFDDANDVVREYIRVREQLNALLVKPVETNSPKLVEDLVSANIKLSESDQQVIDGLIKRRELQRLDAEAQEHYNLIRNLSSEATKETLDLGHKEIALHYKNIAAIEAEDKAKADLLQVQEDLKATTAAQAKTDKDAIKALKIQVKQVGLSEKALIKDNFQRNRSAETTQLQVIEFNNLVDSIYAQNLALDRAEASATALAETQIAEQLAVQEQYNATAEKIEDSFRSTFRSILDGGKSTFVSLRDSATSMVKDVIAELMVLASRRFIINIAAASAGVMGSFGSGIANAGGQAIGGGGMMGGLSSLSSMFTGNGIGQSFMGAGNFLAGNATAGHPSAMAQGGMFADAGGYSNMAYAGTGIISGLIGDAMFGGHGGTGASLGSTIGMAAAGPIGAVIGGLLGGAVGGLFGNNYKDTDTGISTSIDGGNFSVNKFTDQHKKSSLFNGGGDRTLLSDIEAEQAAYFENMHNLTVAGISGMFQKLGVSIEEGALDGLNIAATKISTAGKSETEITEAIGAWFGDVSNEVVQYLNASTAFGLDSDATVKQLHNLSQGLAGTNIVLELIGKNTYQVGLNGALTAASMLDLAGSINGLVDPTVEAKLNALAAASANYYNLFFTQAEKNNDLLTSTSNIMEDLGLVMPATRQGFRDLVDSLDLTTKVGQEMFVTLTKSASAMSATFDVLESAAAATAQAATEAAEKTAAAMAGLVENASNMEIALVSALDAETSAANNLVTAKTKLLNAYDKEMQAQIGIISTFSTVTSNLSDEVLKIGRGGNAEKNLNHERESFNALVALAKTGDVSALKGLVSASRKFLKSSDSFVSSLAEITEVEEKFTSGLLSAKNNLVDAYQREIQAQKDIATTFSDISESLKDAAISFRLSDFSPLSNSQRLTESRDRFNSVSALAATGDEKALGKLASVSEAFLKESQGFNASSTAFTDDFNLVQRTLESAGITSGDVADVADQTLTQLSDQFDLLKSQNGWLESINQSGISTTEAIIAFNVANSELQAASIIVDEANTAAIGINAEAALAASMLASSDSLLVTNALTEAKVISQGIANSAELELEKLETELGVLIEQNGILGTINQSVDYVALAINGLASATAAAAATSAAATAAAAASTAAATAAAAASTIAANKVASQIEADRLAAVAVANGTETIGGIVTDTNMSTDTISPFEAYGTELDQLNQMYMQELGRSIQDIVALEHYGNELKDGRDPADIIADLAYSDEGQAFITPAEQAAIDAQLANTKLLEAQDKKATDKEAIETAILSTINSNSEGGENGDSVVAAQDALLAKNKAERAANGTSYRTDNLSYILETVQDVATTFVSDMGEAIDNYVSTGGMVGAIASGLDTLLSTDDKKATNATVSSASSSNVSSGDSNTNASNVTTTGIASANIVESELTEKAKTYSTYSRFAKGGISREAAIFGEAGPEAAVPLPDGRSIPVTLDKGIEQAIERMALKVVTAVLSTTEAVKDAGRNATQSANRSQAVR